MTNEHEALLRKLICADSLVVVEPCRARTPIGPNCVVIGTSGSTDYLNDATGEKRFWPVMVTREEPDESALVCDGLHDEGEPAHHLCSRCFPDLRGDLTDSADDDDDEDRRDEPQEME